MKKTGLVTLTLGLSVLALQGCFEPSGTAPEDSQAPVAAAISQPDLIVTAASIISQTSTQTHYTYTLKNQGTAPIADLYNVTLQNVFSANTVFNDLGDVAAGSARIGVHIPLAAGATYTGTYVATGAVPAGKSNLIVKVDASGLVAESNEGNNTRLLVARPNLRFSTARITAFVPNGVEYSFTLQNNGGVGIADIHDLVLQNMYSPTTNYNDPGARPAGGAILGVHRSLAAGATYTGTFRTGSPNPGGMNYITFKIDNHGTVTESNENDNTYALSIVPPVLSDLIYTAAAITGRTATGGVIYSYTIKNNGPGHIPDIHSISIQNMYSANTVFNDAGDVGAGGNIIGVHMPLPAGASYSGSYTTPGPVPVDKRNLIFKVDWTEAVFEASETNNTRLLAVP